MNLMEATKAVEAYGYRLNQFMNLYFYKGLLDFSHVDSKRSGQIDAFILEL
jgi:hypothetical protein